MAELQAITIRKRPFSIVPDDVLTNANLSWGARVVLAWMLGRSADFVLYVSYVRKIFRLSEAQWVRYRRQMQGEGYFYQRREKGENGKFRWVNIVSDTPEFSTKEPATTKASAPSLCKPVDGAPLGGTASNGDPTDIPVSIDTNLTKTKQQQTSTGKESLVACKKKRRVIDGITCWDSEDIGEVERLILEYGKEPIQVAVTTLRSKGIEPLPGRVQKVLETESVHNAHAQQQQANRKADNEHMAEKIASDPRAIEAGARIFEKARLKRSSPGD